MLKVFCIKIVLYPYNLFMLDQILIVSHNIIIIGGAVCVLVAVGTMLYVVVVMNKLHKLLTDMKQKYEFISNVIISPFRLLQKMFEE